MASNILQATELRSPENGTVRLDQPRDITPDDRGYIWIATQNGVVLIQPNPPPVTVYHLPAGASSRIPAARALCFDRQDRLWVGTSNGSMYYLDPGADSMREFLFTMKGAAYAWNSMVIDSLGFIWQTCSSIPIVRIDPAKHVAFDPISSRRTPHPQKGYSALVDSASLWIGASDEGAPSGVGVLVHLTLQPFELQQFEYLPNEVKSSGIRLITAIVRRDERSLWVGSPHGLFAFDKASGVFRQYAHKPSDPSSIGGNAVWVVHKDRLGHLWIGTWDGGLNLFDEENASFRHFTMANGLPSNVIQSIVEDERGDLWIATANGIAHYDQQLETFTNFGLADGFVDVEYEPNAAVVASDGKLFFGGSHGVVSFYPRDLTRPKVLAPMFITALRVGGALRVSEIPNGGSTVIDYDDNDPAFEFAKLDYLEPSEKQYEYMLEGLDPSWIYAGSRSNVNYSNLDEGTYRFLFRTKEDTTETYAATIIIAPPFFQRWWFRGGLVFFVVIVGGLVLQRRISRRKAFQAQLDLATENERLDLAGELHDGPLQDLFGARFLLDSLKEANGVGLQAHTLDNLLKKVRGDLRALTGELQIPSFESGFANELQAFCDRFQERYPRINVIEQISTEMTPLQGRIEQNLFRIVRTAMANVAKHAQASRVTVMFEASRTDFLLRIEDDGVGFRVPTDLRLFTEEKHFGLFLMQSYARTIGAKCSIVSELGNGAMIEVRGVLSRPRWKRKRAGTA